MKDEARTMELVSPESMSLVQQQEHAALDVQVSTAKAYPRSVQEFHADLEAWCTLNQETADECFYAKPVDGKKMVGPSIRFGELVQAAYKNLNVDTRVSGEDDGHVVLEATCRDMERNIASRSQVRRSILTKEGKRYKQHMVETTINAGMAIARRNVIFQTVPKALWKPIWNKALAVAKGDMATFEKRRGETLTALKDLGVDMKNMSAFLGGKQTKDIDATDLILLRQRLASIQEHEMTPESAFPAPTKPDPEAAKDSVTAAGEALKNASSNGAPSAEEQADIIAREREEGNGH